MPRTEADIRTALDVQPDPAALDRLRAFTADLAGEAAPASRPVADRNRRRAVLPLLAAAAVVAAVVLGSSVLYLNRQSAPSGGTPAGAPMSAEALRPTWDFASRPVAGYRVERRAALSHGIEAGTYASVTATGTRPETGSVQTCHRALSGCSKDDPRRERVRVRIAGASGWFYDGRHLAREGLVTRLYRRPWTAAYEINDRQPVLALGAGPRLTLVITGTFGFRPAGYDYDNAAAKRVMLRLARATRLHRHATIRMPFALNDVPSPVAPEAVSIHGPAGDCIGYGSGQQGPDPGEWVGTVATACRVRTRSTRARTIHAADHIREGETAAVGVHDYPDGTSVVVEVDAGQGSLISAEQAQHLAGTATVTPTLGDPSSWIAVR